MIPRSLYTQQAPEPIGPYSQAMECGDLIFISGQIPIDPKSGEIVGRTTPEQTLQVMNNLKAILSGVSLGVEALVKTTVFLKRMEDFPLFNQVYLQELHKAAPARSVVEVSSLPKGVLVEIEAIASR
ncbi:Endoribonuclease L-PSP [Chitinispirillum alkaliphilum]|nr:Endoribonuclease L-PSP [Chitinispirillum alkaliphilum]